MHSYRASVCQVARWDRSLGIFVLFAALACGNGGLALQEGGGASTSHSDGGGAGDNGGVLDGGGDPVATCEDDGASRPQVTFYDLQQNTRFNRTGVLDGTIVALGRGQVPDEVLSIDAGTWHAYDPASTRWLRLETTNDAAVIIVIEHVPLELGVLEGSAVSASYTFVPGGWGPTRAALTLTVGGQLAYHFATDGTPSALVLPAGVRVEQDRALCELHSDCGDSALYALSITVEGERAVLETGQQKTLGAYDLWHARTAEQTENLSRCSDWFVADSTLAIASHVPLSAEPDRDAICRQKSAAFQAFVASHRDCSVDSDCSVIGDCSPNADFTSVRADAADEAYRLMSERCSSVSDGPVYIPRCISGQCGEEENTQPGRCCGCLLDQDAGR
jgi:hypothetical protein